MRNLRYPGVIVWPELIKGFQWEEVIWNYLIKVEIFRLSMKTRIGFDENIEELANN